MKKVFYLLTGILVIFSSCKKDIDDNTSTVSFDVKVAFEGIDHSLKDIEVKIENETLGISSSALTNDDGIASFRNVTLGSYKISASSVLTAQKYYELTGVETSRPTINYNGMLNNISINEVPGAQYDLKMEFALLGDILIKQLYYAGSHNTNAASFRDVFVEIYNNSEKVFYADSLYFSQVKGVATKFSTQDLSPGFYITDPNHPLYKQYDWSKSKSNDVGMGAEAYEEYVYVESAFMIPGSGTTYPIAPGESIIIAANAINHKAPYTRNDGKAVEIKDPSLTIDLSNADFEVYYGDIRDGGAYTFDINNPSVPNVEVISIKAESDLIMDATGRDAYIIYKLPKPIRSYPQWAAPDVLVVDGSTKKFHQIPIINILDGVNTLNPNPEASQRNARKLNNKIDAGPTWVTDGQYSSQALMRKVERVEGGRKILKETNNSAEDFITINLPVPYGFASF